MDHTKVVLMDDYNGFYFHVNIISSKSNKVINLRLTGSLIYSTTNSFYILLTTLFWRIFYKKIKLDFILVTN